MTNLILLLAFAAGPTVEIDSLGGDTTAGAITSITSDTIILDSPSGQVTVPLADVRVVRTGVTMASDPESTITLVLTDGSRLPIREYVQNEGVATVTHASLGEWNLPARAVAHVQLKAVVAGTPFATQWETLLRQDHNGDLVVFRRDEALDHLEGVIHEVNLETLDFGFDGDRISPRRTRLEGLIFFHGPAGNRPATIFELIDHLGGKWQVAAAKLDGEVFDITTVSGVAARIPLDRVTRLDFGSANVVYLSDLEEERSVWTPYLQFGEISEFQKQRFGPKKDRNLHGEPLRLGDRVYRKGLALHSRTEISYRLREDFDTFRAMVGLDYRSIGDVGGLAELVVAADGERELLRLKVTADSPPQPIEIKLEDVRRLTILVDYGDENDIGDHVILGEARLTK